MVAEQVVDGAADPLRDARVARVVVRARDAGADPLEVGADIDRRRPSRLVDSRQDVLPTRKLNPHRPRTRHRTRATMKATTAPNVRV